MAVFISSGSLGLAVGPMYFTSLIHWQGMEGSYLSAIPGVLVTILLLMYMRQPAHADVTKARKFDIAPLRAVWKPLVILNVLVILRSAVQVVFGQFLPLYLYRERGFTLFEASAALSMYQVAGALGGFVGGHFTDRFGGRRVIVYSMLGSVPFLSMFFFAHGWVSMAGLGIGGLILLFTVPVNVVMGQSLAPGQAGTVSALMMGFAWGTAGLMFIPLIGWLSDRLSMHTTMSALILFPIIGSFLAMKLPRMHGDKLF